MARKRTRGRCLCVSSTLYSSYIVHFTACGLSCFFPPLWVFHVYRLYYHRLFFSTLILVLTSTIRLWPNYLGDPYSNTLLQVLEGLTEVLTILQCSLKSSYTNSQIYSSWNIFSTASRFLHRTSLPSHRFAYRYTYSASPIGPNRSGPRLLQPIWPMLNLSLNTYRRFVVKQHPRSLD